MMEKNNRFAQFTAQASGRAQAEGVPKQIAHPAKQPPGTFYYAPLPWMQVAAKLSGKTIAVGLALWRLKILNKSHTFKIQRRIMTELGVDRFAMYRALAQLESAGLVQRHSKRPGCGTIVTLIEVSPTTQY